MLSVISLDGRPQYQGIGLPGGTSSDGARGIDAVWVQTVTLQGRAHSHVVPKSRFARVLGGC